MSPELFGSDGLDSEESRPTKESDCYALGMVIYEVLSGQVLYAQRNPLGVVQKILAGECPGRPQGTLGALFTDDIWNMVELCWKVQPADRPSLNAVLLCFQDVTRPTGPSDVDPGMFSPFPPSLAPKYPCSMQGHRLHKARIDPQACK